MWTKALVLIVMGLTASLVEARMYQWTDADSGNTQLSGNPPSWYRGQTRGPRIFVFEQGRLIDDTSIAVEEPERQALRANAFRQAGEMATLAQARRAAQARASLKDAESDSSMSLDEPFADDPRLVDTVTEEPVEAQTDNTIATLKALIEAWDIQRTQDAKEIIDSQIDDF